MLRNILLLSVLVLPQSFEPTYADAEKNKSGMENFQHSDLQAILTTIFMGNADKSQEFLDSLAERYRRFLNVFVNDVNCLDNPGGEEGTIGCRRVHAEEISLSQSNSWTRRFNMSYYEFSEFGSRSLGSYRFSKAIPITREFKCEFILQLQVVFNAPAQQWTKEYFAECQVLPAE